MRAAEYLPNTAARLPEKTALVFQGHTVSYGELAGQSRQLAAALRQRGIGPGDAIGLMLPNLPQFASLLFAGFHNGSRVVPMNVMLQPPEIRYLVEDSELRLLATYEAFLPHVLEGIRELENPPLVVAVGKGPFAADAISFAELAGTPAEAFDSHPSDPDDAILTLYTSGTTGKPKGALITNANLDAQLDMTEQVFQHEDDDRTLCVLPLFHVFALNGLLVSSVRSGGTVVLHPRFEVADTVRSLAEDDITIFAGVPTMYFYVLKHPQLEQLRFPKLRTCFSGGAAMPVEVMRQFEDRFDVEICEGYGLTETTVSVCCNRPGHRKVGSIGIPYSGVEMKIIDDDGNALGDGEVGEIVVRSANVMKGYLNKPEATAESIKDGWFYSGDLGYRDEDGYYFIVDRKKDMIIKGGFNIYPREIEEVIYQLAQVAEAAVIGVHDPAKGETVRAVIALKPGQELSQEAVEEHLEANLAKYKLPTEYLFVEELPKGPTGKILKRELRDAAGAWNRDRVQAS